MTSTLTYLRSVYIPGDRITHVTPHKQVVLGFKEFLYRYALHPKFIVLNAKDYSFQMNSHFIQCPLRSKRIIRLVLPKNPVFRTKEAGWKTTAMELHYILNSGVRFDIYQLDNKQHSQQFLFIPV